MSVTVSSSSWMAQHVVVHTSELVRKPVVLLIGGVLVVGALRLLRNLNRVVTWVPFPGPRERWILGPNRESNPLRSLSWLEDLYAAHCSYNGADSSPVSFRFFGKVQVMVANKDDINHVLSNRPDIMTRTTTVRGIFDTGVQPGLFTAEGQEWKCQRRVYAPAFSNKNSQSMLPIMAEKASLLADRLQQLQTVDNGTEWFKYLAADVLLQAAFGLRFDYLLGASEEEGGGYNPRAILQDMEDHQKDARKRIFNLFLFFSATLLPRWLAARLHPDNAKKFARVDRLAAFAQQVIQRRKEALARDESVARNDLLDQAILCSDKQQEFQWSPTKVESVLTANMTTFFAAGSETTAVTLAWITYYLASRPTWQARCRAQVRTLFKLPQLERGPLAGHEDSEGHGTGAAGLESVTLVVAAMRETMRLKPAIPFLVARNPHGAFSLRGATLPRGSSVMLLLRKSMRDNPHLDAPAEWRPDRWLRTGTDELRGDMETIAPNLAFGGGRRVCPGRRMAELEILQVVCTLLLRFDDIQLLCPPEEVQEYQEISVRPSKLPLRFVPAVQ